MLTIGKYSMKSFLHIKKFKCQLNSLPNSSNLTRDRKGYPQAGKTEDQPC